MTNDPVELARRAMQLWPDSTFNQVEWQRAWAVLRSTQLGPQLDRASHVPQQQPQFTVAQLPVEA